MYFNFPVVSFKFCFSSVLLMLSLPWLHVILSSSCHFFQYHDVIVITFVWKNFAGIFLCEAYYNLHNLTSLFIILHIYTSKAAVMWGCVSALLVLMSSVLPCCTETDFTSPAPCCKIEWNWGTNADLPKVRWQVCLLKVRIGPFCL